MTIKSVDELVLMESTIGLFKSELIHDRSTRSLVPEAGSPGTSRRWTRDKRPYWVTPVVLQRIVQNALQHILEAEISPPPQR